MSEDTEPEYILFQNESPDADYAAVRDQLTGVKYEEVDSDDQFNNSVIPGKPVLGVRTSIGYIPHRGYESIEEVLDVLEGDEGARLDAGV